MNAEGVVLAIAHYGEPITIKRMTGIQRVSFAVEVQAHVTIGGGQLLVAGVLQIADVIRMTDREMKASQWPAPPRHGDQIVFRDGRVSTIQGRVQDWHLDDGDEVYLAHILGG